MHYSFLIYCTVVWYYLAKSDTHHFVSERDAYYCSLWFFRMSCECH